jgi:hypothetical protein
MFEPLRALNFPFTYQSSDPNVSSSSTNTHVEEETTNNVTTPQTRETQLATYTVSSETELDDDICTVCLKKEKSTHLFSFTCMYHICIVHSFLRIVSI